METNKVNPGAIKQAAQLYASSSGVQAQAQTVSPAVNGGAQFTTGTQSSSVLVPGQPNAAAQGVTGLYGINPGDWFWNSWARNAQKNGMQNSGGGLNFQEAGVMPKLGKVWLPDEFWVWARQKQEQAFQEDFNRFVFSQVDVSTPQGRAYWEKKFPGYTQQVYDAWSIKMQTQAKIAEIQIKGFQNESDLWFAYLYQNGYFDRMLTPPTDRLVPLAQDQPFTISTPATSMPAIPTP